jgi:hypothetical protein
MKNWNTKYPKRFDLDSEDDYQKWRDEKLAAYPKNLGELVVELGDMTAITKAEKSKIIDLVERANMCVYSAGSADLCMDSLLKLGEQIGVSTTDKSTRHTNSDELTASGILNQAIPFTTRHVNWHTDARPITVQTRPYRPCFYSAKDPRSKAAATGFWIMKCCTYNCATKRPMHSKP